MDIYCVYLTVYRGSKMPPFYIGSSSIRKIDKGYRGSVCSKQYKDVWKSELTHNPHLFETKIISTHADRKEATLRERWFQQKVNAVRNPLYTNQSYAAYDSFTDRDQTGKNNPMYGTSRSGKDNPFYGRKHTDISKAKMRGRKCTEENKRLYSELKKGISDSNETRRRKSAAKKGKPPNSAHMLRSLVSDKYLCRLDNNKHYNYTNACQYMPEIKHMFWVKRLS